MNITCGAQQQLLQPRGVVEQHQPLLGRSWARSCPHPAFSATVSHRTQKMSPKAGMQKCSASRHDDNQFEPSIDPDYSGPNMMPLDADSAGGLGGTSDELFGPLAALLIGFTQEQFEIFRTMMIDMEADIVKMIPCRPAMLNGTLKEALEAPQGQPFEQMPKGTRRAVLLSGMSTGEVFEVLGAWRDTEGLPDTLWGAAVPNNYEKCSLRDLVSEMYQDRDYTHAAEDRAEQDRAAGRQ
mmetsp:Transcript_20411/g.61472  ORF Transcript_20411/g.61472 Transcript_20411/m.61472 type:complete len:239 (+) Transcript_20411:214-930(+)